MCLHVDRCCACWISGPCAENIVRNADSLIGFTRGERQEMCLCSVSTSRPCFWPEGMQTWLGWIIVVERKLLGQLSVNLVRHVVTI